MQRILHKVEDMGLMINRMLQYARFGGGKLELRPTDCAAVYTAACDRLRGLIEESGAAVTAGQLPTVLADQAHLVQVFENLIGNALKYRADKRALKVRVTAELRDGEWLFRVKDNGIGIEPEYFERIFVLFKRLHTEKIPGHGIGLSFCKKVIEHHGGRIWVESTYRKGSTFSFTLPAMASSEPEPVSAPPARTPTHRRKKPRGGGSK
jgi:light-regulated signal transduction histidine kinase (bacteriophytochrome)